MDCWIFSRIFRVNILGYPLVLVMEYPHFQEKNIFLKGPFSSKIYRSVSWDIQVGDVEIGPTGATGLTDPKKT